MSRASHARRRLHCAITGIDLRDPVVRGSAEIHSAIRPDGDSAQTIRSLVVHWRFWPLDKQARRCGECESSVAIPQFQPMPLEVPPATVAVEIEKADVS